MDNSIKSGLLLNDISDHLPVFIMCACDHMKLKDNNVISYRRIRTVESMNKLRSELFKHNWEQLCEETDTDKAYETFLMIFKTLYDEQCPLK